MMSFGDFDNIAYLLTYYECPSFVSKTHQSSSRAPLHMIDTTLACIPTECRTASTAAIIILKSSSVFFFAMLIGQKIAMHLKY